METLDLREIFKKTVSIQDYLESLAQPFKERFMKRKEAYQLNMESVRRLEAHAKNVVIVVFSAEWCKDCANNVPVLALLAEKTSIKVRVFGGLKKDPLNPKEKWRIPPSPPEVKTFNVDKIPYIIIFEKTGKRIGEIVENPRHRSTLEDEIAYMVTRALSQHFG